MLHAHSSGFLTWNCCSQRTQYTILYTLQFHAMALTMCGICKKTYETFAQDLCSYCKEEDTHSMYNNDKVQSPFANLNCPVNFNQFPKQPLFKPILYSIQYEMYVRQRTIPSTQNSIRVPTN